MVTSSFSSRISKLFKVLNRKKTGNIGESSPLAQVLNLVDLVTLGVGGTLGLGVYVLAGSVAKTVAGPAVCISFLIAAIASGFAGICYAEFAARVPKAGSAYTYSYVSVGEFMAFIIGWNLILEYVIGTASVATGMSNYLDTLLDKQVKNALLEWMPMNTEFLAPNPDFLSLVFIIALTAILSFGVKESSIFNYLLTVINLLTIATAIIAASIKADVNNWKIDPSTLHPKDQIQAGSGGFLPFGVAGVMAGAAKCFYGFIGFDAVATTAEEAKNAQRDVPIAIVITLFVICILYFIISTVLTMAWPYYLQDSEAPFPFFFDQLGWHTIKWIVTIGAIFALCTSLLNCMISMPRVVYAMSSDGVIFKALSKVNTKTKTPIIATVASGLLAGVLSVVFDLDQLIDMMSIGTLMAYTMVAVSVLLLRYQPIVENGNSKIDVTNNKPESHSIENFKLDNTQDSRFMIIKNVLNLNHIKSPTKESLAIFKWSLVLYGLFSVLFCATISNGRMLIFSSPFYMFAFTTTTIGIIAFLVIMIRQPAACVKLSFKVPLVPYVPCLSVVFNLYLMFELSLQTWIRFLVWLMIGFIVYFFYGIKHSKESESNRKAKDLVKQQSEDQMTSL